MISSSEKLPVPLSVVMMPVAQFTVRRSPGIQVSIACRQVAGTIRKGSRQSSPVF